MQQLGAPRPTGGMLVLDDTGLRKHGAARPYSRQHSGTRAKIGNGQILVSAASAAYGEDAPRAPPDPAALAGAGPARPAHIPPEVAAPTTLEIALRLVDRARAGGVPCAVVVADAG